MPIHRLNASPPYLSVILSTPYGVRTVRALIDTGASITAVHPKYRGTLQPPASRQVDVTQVGGRKEFVSTYIYTIQLGPDDREFTLEAVAIPPASDCDILIGRDLMSLWVMTWDGGSDRLTIAY